MERADADRLVAGAGSRQPAAAARGAYAKMGLMGFAQVNVDALHTRDEDAARQFDARRNHIAKTIADGK